jgi:N-acetylmuramoyl-L-alanine amidase
MLLEGIEHIAAADMGGPLVNPSLIVMHYTAGASFASDLRQLTSREEPKVSAHFLIGRDGRTAQLVPLDRVAYHAGASEHNGRKHCNGFSIGIELTNWGPLRKRDLNYYAWPSDYSRTVVPESEVVAARHKHPACAFDSWHAFPPAQIIAAVDLVRRIQGVLPTAKEIVGHEDISPGRKIDPGPAFPWCLFGRFVPTP